MRPAVASSSLWVCLDLSGQLLRLVKFSLVLESGHDHDHHGNLGWGHVALEIGHDNLGWVMYLD